LVLAFVAFLSVGGRLYTLGEKKCEAAVGGDASGVYHVHVSPPVVGTDEVEKGRYSGDTFSANSAALAALAMLAAAGLASPPRRGQSASQGTHSSATGVGTAGLAGLGLSYALPIVGAL